MITSFFRTSKPIHFVILLAYLLILFVSTRLSVLIQQFNFIAVLTELFLCLLLLSSVFMLDFFSRKNDLTQKNSYKVLIFTLLLGVFPIVFKVDNVLIANFFILLSFRRTISIRNGLTVKKKLLDASFWVGIAALFYFWSLLFFLVIIAALLLYAVNDIKNWIIPFVGLLCVVAFTVSYSLLTNNKISELHDHIQSISLDLSAYNITKLIIAITIVTSLSLWALFFYINNLKTIVRAKKPGFLLVIIAMLVSGIIIIIAPNKNGSEFIFGFAFLSIIITNYLETVKERWFAELFVWILLITPITYILL